MDIKTIDKSEIKAQLNRCYVDFDKEWEWGRRPSVETMLKFHDYLVEHAGLDIYMGINEDVSKSGYQIHRVQLVNEQQYTLWMLRWS